MKSWYTGATIDKDNLEELLADIEEPFTIFDNGMHLDSGMAFPAVVKTTHDDAQPPAWMAKLSRDLSFAMCHVIACVDEPGVLQIWSVNGMVMGEDS